MENGFKAEVVEAAGYKVGNDGKIRDGSRLVTKAKAELIGGGSILKGFSLDDLKKKKARTGQTGGKSLVQLLGEVAPAIEHLAVNETAKIAIPPKKPSDTKDLKRSFVMGIVTKLNNLTSLGREWSGRVFDSASDEKGEYFYVTRLEDTDNPRDLSKRKGSSGNAGKDSLAASLSKAREHLGGGQEAKAGDADAQKAAEAAADGAEVVIGGEEGTKVVDDAPAGGEALEEATVVKH